MPRCFEIPRQAGPLALLLRFAGVLTMEKLKQEPMFSGKTEAELRELLRTLKEQHFFSDRAMCIAAGDCIGTNDTIIKYRASTSSGTHLSSAGL